MSGVLAAFIVLSALVAWVAPGSTARPLVRASGGAPDTLDFAPRVEAVASDASDRADPTAPAERTGSGVPGRDRGHPAGPFGARAFGHLHATDTSGPSGTSPPRSDAAPPPPSSGVPIAVATGNAGTPGNAPGALAGALRSTMSGVTGLPDLSAYGLLAVGLVAVGAGLLIYNLTARRLSA